MRKFYFHTTKMPAVLRTVEDVCKRDVDQFAKVYDEQYDCLYNYALKLTRNKEVAEDLVQEAFAKLWEKSGEEYDIRDLRSYLCRMVYNLRLSELRKEAYKKTYMEYAARYASCCNEATKEVVEVNECKRVLMEAINRLPLQRRRVFTLSKIEGWTIDEIAEHLGVSAFTVKVTLQAAKKAVRKEMGVEEGGRKGKVKVKKLLNNEQTCLRQGYGQAKGTRNDECRRVA